MSDSRSQSIRNIGLLSAVQALGGSSSSIIMSVAALAAVNFAPDRSAATLPVTAMIVGLALATSSATMIIYRLGRTRGLMLGAAIGIPGSLIATLAVFLGQFYLFAGGLFLVGVSGAFMQQLRFAAADSVAPQFKSQAISWVMFGGVAAGFFGPQLSALTRTWVPGAEYAASFMVIAVLSFLSVLVLSATRLAPTTPPGDPGDTGRPLSVLLRLPEVVLPMMGAALTYALMTLIMVAAPLAMVHLCGHSPTEAAGAIQWHVVAMFAPSFVTGAIIKRIGPHLVTAIGLLLIISCAVIALSGISVTHFTATLVLLGLGWNFGFIGSTAMLATNYRPQEAGRVQAVNEQVVFGASAIASLSSGVLLQMVGWEAINMLAIPVATLAILLLGLGAMRQARA
ncbi:MFS transporter [Devosia sp. XJ19-1]|uniref:MFS transporter n=1 Tax=Devosia ureilytica TaxID=2952754 RepID=A0A9Q4FQW8_9HYPH|nr:MFS transporter [Devosia ureilytica]MCP8882505.1 MFS transporter [Devosia ureilytica]MCP8885608.1 MFS transporter [Devosia ureilytica]